MDEILKFASKIGYIFLLLFGLAILVLMLFGVYEFATNKHSSSVLILFLIFNAFLFLFFILVAIVFFVFVCASIAKIIIPKPKSQSGTVFKKVNYEKRQCHEKEIENELKKRGQIASQETIDSIIRSHRNIYSASFSINESDKSRDGKSFSKRENTPNIEACVGLAIFVLFSLYAIWSLIHIYVK